MRIGIVPCLDKSAGGVYQYSLTMLEALLTLQRDGVCHDLVIFTDDLENENLFKFKDSGWDIVPLYPTTAFRLIVRKFIKNTIIEAVAAQILKTLRVWSHRLESIPEVTETSLDAKQRRWFLSQKVDVMIYPTSNALSFQTMIPYIFTIHDLNHRIYTEFPEVSAPNEWKDREYVFVNSIKNALLVLVDSPVGKEDVLKFYKITQIMDNQVKILPFLPAPYIENKKVIEIQKVFKLFKLPKEYIFYPAQFWPHKNHLRIIEALGLIKKKYNLDIPIVLCGSHSGKIREDTFKNVLSLAIKSGIKQNIIYLGYVDDKYMSVLYKKAQTLIMPTFFGPTNIPILEAWTFGCPVITSDIRGIREQAGNAAFLVNPRSVDSIANGIKEVWEDKNLRNELAKLGKKRLAIFDKDDYNKRLSDIINEAKVKINIIN